MNELTNIGTRVIASDINVDWQLILGRRLLWVWITKNLVRYPFKERTKQNVSSNEKSVKVGETVVQMSSDQISSRLLASAAQDEAPLLEIFFHELSGVAP